MSVELDVLAMRVEAAGYPTLAAGFRRDAQLIRELNGPEYFITRTQDQAGEFPQKASYIDFEALPQIENPIYRELAERINVVIGANLDDETKIHDLYFWKQAHADTGFSTPFEEWTHFMLDLSREDRRRIDISTGSIYRLGKGHYNTRLGSSPFTIDILGDLRRTPPDELAKGAYMSPNKALFMLHAFRPLMP